VAIATVTRKLAAILAADMVGYSRHMEADEAGTIARLREHHADLIDPAIAAFNGRIVKTTGDGLLAEFASAADAVLCAVEIQRGLAAREADQPDDRRVAYRIGINLGDIVVEGDDVLGDGVNIAARLEALAKPGGICISDVVFKSVRGKLDLGFADLGPQTVKNISEPIPTYEVLIDPAAAGTLIAARSKRRAAWRWPALAAVLAVVLVAAAYVIFQSGFRPATVASPSIAVLPFANLSGNPQQDYLSDGITEDLITALTRFSSLLVSARTATFRYKNRTVDEAQIGRELKVVYVLKGSVRRDGERVRVTAQLIDTRSGANLWAERYDRKAEDIFAVQDEITGRIVATLVAQVSRAEIQRVRRKPPKSFVAYDHYLQAVHLHRRIFAVRERGAPIAEARQHLDAAVAMDSGFALAYTQLAYNYYHSWAHPTRVAALTGEFANPKTLTKALAVAQKAVDTDPRVAEAHAALGYVLFWLRRPDEAFAAYRRAFAINPNLQDDGYTAALALGGRSKECIAYIGRMLRTDPTHGRHYGNLGLCYYHMHDYAKAAALLETCKQFARGWRACWTWRAAALGQLGRTAEAKAEAAENMRRDPDFTIARWMRHFGRNFARRADAEHVVEGLRKAGLPE